MELVYGGLSEHYGDFCKDEWHEAGILENLLDIHALVSINKRLL